MDSPVYDDFKNSDERDLNEIQVYPSGFGKDVRNNTALGGVMWSIGYNYYKQQGNGNEYPDQGDVYKLTVHQWAKDIDIIKVVSNGMNSFLLHD